MMLLHLRLAYIATWAIHGAYLTFLAVKSTRIRRELRKLESKK
ncbi:MAG TPA: CcmD family protein [Terriglobales bacterium]|nr:CcmD family protein [Terriglobales bacterium]